MPVLCLFGADFLKGEAKTHRRKSSFDEEFIDSISPKVFIKSIFEGAATVYFEILNNLGTLKLVENEWEFCL